MKKKHIRVISIVTIVVIIAVVLSVVLIMKNKKSTGTSDNFTCPTTPYINCMPQVGRTAAEKAAAEKQARYCDFVAKNCPNVIIAE